MSIVDMLDSPAGVLWDMDGTLLDSEPEWAAATRRAVESRGGVWGEKDAEYILGANIANHTARMVSAVEQSGATDVDGAAMMLEVTKSVENHMRHEAELMPGAVEALREFAAAGIEQVLVTASAKLLVDALFDLLEKKLGFQPLKDAVSGDDKIPGKPDPAPYQTAAAKLGLAPSQCVAFEDSPHGLQAARAAGCRVIDVNQRPLTSFFN